MGSFLKQPEGKHHNRKLSNYKINSFCNYYLIQISFQWEIINSLLITGSVGTENENLVVGNFGLEYTAFDSFFIRAGIQTAPLLPSLGIGYNFSCFTIDVASIYHPILGMSTGLGLSFSF